MPVTGVFDTPVATDGIHKSVVPHCKAAHEIEAVNGLFAVTSADQDGDAAKSQVSFVKDVQIQEMRLCAMLKMQAIEKTQISRIAGRDLIEFVLLGTRPQVTSRHVHLRHGDYMLTFVFNSARDEGRMLFDDFLNSIRLESEN